MISKPTKYAIGTVHVLQDEIELEHDDGSWSYVEPGLDITVDTYDSDRDEYTLSCRTHSGFFLCADDMDRFFDPKEYYKYEPSYCANCNVWMQLQGDAEHLGKPSTQWECLICGHVTYVEITKGLLNRK